MTDPNVFETANAGFAQAIYENYLKDPGSVAPEWRQLFDGGRVGERPPVVAAPTNGAPPANRTTAVPGGFSNGAKRENHVLYASKNFPFHARAGRAVWPS